MKGVSNALNVCAQNVIPSLFPFLFLSSFISKSGIIKFKGRFMSSAFKKLFGAESECLGVILLSALGGFPVGAKTAESFLDSGNISERTAKRLVLSCANPSPSFAISAVGFSLFSSKRLGLIIYASVVISNLIIFVLSRYIFDRNASVNRNQAEKDTEISSSFVSAGKTASDSMISICTYVILFSCFCEIIRVFIASEEAIAFICSVFEVTSGTVLLASLGNVPLIAGVIGWGGISVLCQILGTAKRVKLNIKLLFASRALSAFLSVLICDILMRIFPTATGVIKISESVNIISNEKNIAVSLMMLLSCFIFLIGDYRIVRSKKEILK